MKVALLLFILGVSLIILGYSRQISEDTCQSEVVVKYNFDESKTFAVEGLSSSHVS